MLKSRILLCLSVLCLLGLVTTLAVRHLWTNREAQSPETQEPVGAKEDDSLLNEAQQTALFEQAKAHLEETSLGAQLLSFIGDPKQGKVPVGFGACENNFLDGRPKRGVR